MNQNRKNKIIGLVGMGLIGFGALIFFVIVIIGLASYGQVYWGFEPAAYTITLIGFIAECVTIPTGLALCVIYLIKDKREDEILAEGETPSPQRKKMKLLALIASILAGVVIITLLIAVCTGGGKGVSYESAYLDLLSAYSDVRNTYDGWSYMKMSSGGFTIDSNPTNSTNSSTQSAGISVVSQIIPALHNRAGIPSYIWTQMKSTSALDGLQTATYDDVFISWTYHPSRGLEVSYSDLG